MTENIMKENLMYLEAWMSYNPSLKEHLKVNNNFLIYQNGETTEQIDISNFYLPDMLINENFREKVSNELNSEDLFQIIKIYIQTKEIIEKEQDELQMSPRIQKLLVKNDDKEEFIVLIDENNRKYRYDTDHLEQVINDYVDIYNKNGVVTLKELGKVIQNGN